jgi:DNA (cytosine-5)-methyltransferase 1
VRASHQFSLLKRIDSAQRGIVVDLFAGGGGASTGIEAALGRPVDLALNHDATALAAHCANHPDTEHLEADIWSVDPKRAVRGRKVDILWMSPACQHHSRARGGKPRQDQQRSLAWAGVRWVAATTPRLVFLENVLEFGDWGPLDAHGQPIKERKGETFARFVRKLERLGYVVEWRALDASKFGAPTKRRRLFLIARRDGLPIVWPEPTHGPGLLPLHTAAECIDWSLPCPSIFERERPLAEKTLWRIAQGIKRFVLENPKPFIVNIDQQSNTTAEASADSPLSTVTTKARHALVAPSIVGVGGRSGQSKPTGMREPVGTVTSKNDRALIAPSLVKVNHGKDEARGESLESPPSTVVASRRGHALVAGTLVQSGYGERRGQSARVLDIEEPLGTIVADGVKQACVAAFLNKHYGNGVVGQVVDKTIGTVTATDHHSLAAASLVKIQGASHGIGIEEPMPTIVSGGRHVAEVRAFLTAYYGTNIGDRIDVPARTITSKHRLGLVTVEGIDFQIVDIGMRMLEDHELLRAQFGRFAKGYDLSAARTKAGRVKLIGNSVPPEVAEVLVRANALPEPSRRAA